MRFTPGYRMARLALVCTALAIVVTVIGVIVKILAGNAALLVLGLLTIAVSICTIWASLTLLHSWARSRQRRLGGTVYDALMTIPPELRRDLKKVRSRDAQLACRRLHAPGSRDARASIPERRTQDHHLLGCARDGMFCVRSDQPEWYGVHLPTP